MPRPLGSRALATHFLRAEHIDDARLRALVEPAIKSGYGEYLLDVLASSVGR